MYLLFLVALPLPKVSWLQFTADLEHTESKLYWGDRAIWNNSGDTVYLRDSVGNVVDKVSYSGGGTEWIGEPRN